MYSCPYHDHIGINQGEKNLLTDSQRVWKKLLIFSTWDAGVLTRNLCFTVSKESQWVLPPSPCLPMAVGAWGWRFLGRQAWARGLSAQWHWGTSTGSGCAALFCVFMGDLATTSAWRKHVRLCSISRCIFPWSPRTKSAFVLLVVGVTADVSGAAAMKYQNRAPERKKVQFNRAQAKKQVTVA